jgi:hypothetical protein
MMKLLALSAPLLTGGVAIAACGSAADPPSRATVAKLTHAHNLPACQRYREGYPAA